MEFFGNTKALGAPSGLAEASDSQIESPPAWVSRWRTQQRRGVGWMGDQPSAGAILSM
jgi:hypothetical protein